MAAGKTCVRGSKEETGEWAGLFVNDLKTKRESLLLVKRMVAVVVSSITYLRGIFPEEAYRSRYLEDLCVKVLREDCKRPGASKIVKWLMGCFDALEKQYLQIVFIGVYTNPDQPNCIMESYQFKFKYTDKGPKMDTLSDAQMQVSLDDTKAASVLLIRKLFLLMQNLGTLPSGVYLTMKLYYYDDVTPEEYEPPGFKEGESDSLWFEGCAVNFKLGEVKTAFHSLIVRVSAEQGCMKKLQEDNKLSETKPVTQSTLEERKPIKAPLTKTYNDRDLPSDDESAQFKKPTKPLAKRLRTTKNLSRKKGRARK